jgi:uncharacterized protein (DUF2336 family)
LAQDIALQVREALAFELRKCRYLPHDLAAKIAADVESVASPFLANTEVFTDLQLAGLIPHLEEHAHITIARRGDVGPHTSLAIVSVGSEKSVSFLVRNDHIELAEDTCGKVVERFGASRAMMDMLARRVDLPLSIVEALIEKISDECRKALVKQYDLDEPLAAEVSLAGKFEAIWRQLEKANSQQIHDYVVELRRQQRLTTDMTLEFASRGKLAFMESALALEAGLTLCAVREALYSGNMRDFVHVMREAGISKAAANEFRRIIKFHKGCFH